MKIVLFFFLYAETYFRPLPYTFLTPTPSPSFLLFQVLGFFSLAWFWPKAQKRRFRKRLGRAQGPFVYFGTGAGNLARLSHGGSFKETSVLARRGRPLRAPRSAAMGEMQGALARARLESLLRPRHKKRAEAQKRSESVLLSGLAFMKQRRMGLNDFIQKIASNTYACKHAEVQSILKMSQPPPEPELMNANPSPPPSPSQQINLGPSSNPHAKPSDFHFLKVIGKGSFGKVLLARHKAEEAFYAVKVLQKKAILKKKEEKHIMSERNVLLKNVKHPFLVGLHFSFQTADKLYFVLDYINGGELFYHLQRERCFLEPRARFYAAEIASALGYLHSLHIVYRDLKPENILLDSQGHIVLTDFGLCKENIEHNGTTSTFCGTPEYLAPEVLHKQPYDRTVDWWCLGAVLYEMLYGLPPFYSRNTAEMYDNILNKPLQLKPNITNSARHLLESLLQKDRTKRLGAKDDFMEIKSHIFFSLINWDDLINKKITPPFNPNVSGPSDLRHFDPEFTEEPVPSSIGRSPDSILVTASVKEAAEAFLGFSYAPPMDSFL
ncbi:serine/threonine-protein kinase Sgk1 isoform X1 [Arvicanthis niloticus]|uniref:serine/threonine-protein kinase Sgk1 isoform X1 n=1 Tax=Arvicanthis niloticus TaxID=61156 RepID=UPI00402B19B0